MVAAAYVAAVVVAFAVVVAAVVDRPSIVVDTAAGHELAANGLAYASITVETTYPSWPAS